jgi:hypothetical protein
MDWGALTHIVLILAIAWVIVALIAAVSGRL